MHAVCACCATTDSWSRPLRIADCLVMLCVMLAFMPGIYGPRRSVLDSVTSSTKSDSQRRRSRQQYTSRCHVGDICQVLLASMNQPRGPGVTVYNIVDDEPAGRQEVERYAVQLLLKSGVDQQQPHNNNTTGLVMEEVTREFADKESNSAGATPAGVHLPASSSTGDQAQELAAAGTSACDTAGNEMDLAAASYDKQHAVDVVPDIRRSRGAGAGIETVEQKRVRNSKIKDQLGVHLLYPSYQDGLTAILTGDTDPFTPAELACLGK